MHALKPELFRYSDLAKMNSAGRMNHALYHGKNSLGVNPLFTIEGNVENPYEGGRTCSVLGFRFSAICIFTTVM